MAFIVKRTFVRTDDSTAWPWESMSSADTSALVSARADNNVTQSTTTSDNGLLVSYTESCVSYDDYLPYFEVAMPIWTANNLGDTPNIDFSYEVIENS